MAGSVTVTRYKAAKDGSTITIKLACTGDSSNGSVPATQIPETITQEITGRPYTRCGMYLTGVSVVDGATTPDAADIAVTDELSRTLYSEANVIPASGTKYGTVSEYYLVESKLTVTVSNQGTANALWDMYLTLSK